MSDVVIKLYPQGTVMICGEWDSSDISMHQVMSVTGFLRDSSHAGTHVLKQGSV